LSTTREGSEKKSKTGGQERNRDLFSTGQPKEGGGAVTRREVRKQSIPSFKQTLKKEDRNWDSIWKGGRKGKKGGVIEDPSLLFLSREKEGKGEGRAPVPRE